MAARFAVAALLLALCGWPAQVSVAQAQRTLTIDDIFQYATVEDPQISPDGSAVLYVTSRRDLKENVQNTDIWKVSTAGGTPVQLTYSPKADRMPRWSPDGKLIAFISNRSGKNQIYLMDSGGGEAFALTNQKDGAESFDWSHDGKLIAFTGVEPRTDELEKQVTERWVPRVIDYDWRYAALWAIDLASKKATQLTKGKYQVNSFDWSPDGSLLTFSATATPDLDDGDTAEVYVVPTAGGDIRKLVGFKTGDTNPHFSPDGKSILFSSRGDEVIGAGNANFYVIPTSGGTPRNLSKDFDESPQFIAWQGDKIYFGAAQKTYRHLFTLPADPVTSGKVVYGGFSFDRDFRKVAFIRESAGQPPDIYVADNGAFDRARKLTEVNPQLKGISLGTQEVTRWKNSSGQEVEGVLVKPVGYQAGKKYPLLLVIHGGPSGVDMDNYTLVKSAYPVQVFAGKGYAVLSVNYRGSTAYGEKWLKGNFKSLGDNEFDDINTGIDALIAQGLADADRLGFMGWSYGGHMTYWAITHSNRFKAASAGAGATNLVSMYAQTDMPGFYSRTYFGFPPWENFDYYVQHSSFWKVASVKTPTLIQYGEKDARVPLPQGLEFYRALKERGVPSMLIVYPDQGHGIIEPRYQKDLIQRNLDWFDRWIKNGGTP